MKFIEPLGQKGLRRKKYYQFTAIDDCTRLRVLRAYPRCDQKTAISFVDDVMAKLPFQVERVQTDNGSEFGQSSTGICSTSASTTSASNPAPHGSTARWSDPTGSTPKSSTRLLDGQVIDDTNLFTDKLQEWEDYYNYHRPHGALNGQTPYERLRQKTQDPLS